MTEATKARPKDTGVLHINTRKRKQGGYLAGVEGAMTLLLAAVGGFWLLAGIGIGWLLWH